MRSVGGQGASGTSAVRGDWVPGKGAVVSADVLAQVFGNKQLPFRTNPDGSVDMEKYLVWLNEAGLAALKAFDDCFEVEDGMPDLSATRLA